MDTNEHESRTSPNFHEFSILRTMCAHCAPEPGNRPLTPSLSPFVGERVPDVSAVALAKAEGRVESQGRGVSLAGGPPRRVHSCSFVFIRGFHKVASSTHQSTVESSCILCPLVSIDG